MYRISLFMDNFDIPKNMYGQKQHDIDKMRIFL